MDIKTGHEHIDHHHEELFNLISMLDQAIATNKRISVEPIIEFLENYSRDHFKEEEDVMESNNYIGLSLHRAEHHKFTSLITDLRTLYIQNKPTAHIIFFIRKIIDQLTHHIKTVDSGIKNMKRRDL